MRGTSQALSVGIRVPHVFIVGFVLLQVALIARCYVADATFFGWQMFSNTILYRTQFYAVHEGSARTPLEPDTYERWIHGWAREYLAPSSAEKSFGRGRRFLLDELSRVPRYLCDKLNPGGPGRIEVTVEHRQIGEDAATVNTFQHVCGV